VVLHENYSVEVAALREGGDEPLDFVGGGRLGVGRRGREGGEQKKNGQSIQYGFHEREPPRAPKIPADEHRVVSGVGEALPPGIRSISGIRDDVARDALEVVWLRQWVLANVAITQAFADQVDAAIVTLDQLLSEPTNALSVLVIQSSPAFDSLRANHEFARVLEARSQAN
jgi:hypothetical protein